jgi:hypothetical protein
MRVNHGMSKSPEYRIWSAMIARCENVNNKRYQHYGGRGIGICPKWRGSFLAFYVDMGERPPGHQIDRINNNAGYSPENCRWVTPRENQLNKNNNRRIEFRGEIKTVSQWAEKIGAELGLRPNTVALRIRDGIPPEFAFTKRGSRAKMKPPKFRTEKCCSRCRTTKPLIEYHRKAASWDGRFHMCKVCVGKRDKSRSTEREILERKP